MRRRVRIDMAAVAGYDLDMVASRCRILPFCAALALSSFAMRAHAAQVLSVLVTRDGPRFVIDMHIKFHASPPAVFRALQDYPAMMRYNPDLRAVRVQSTGVPGRTRLFTTVHACVLVFCKTMHQEQIMTAVTDRDGGVLEAQLLPRGGDFKMGHARWTVTPCPAGGLMACLDATIQLVPAFWVPPVIGPWALRRQMAEEARRTSVGLEIVARASRAQAAKVPRASALNR